MLKIMIVEDLAAHIIPKVNDWIEENSRCDLNLMAEWFVAVRWRIIINLI